MKFKVLTEACPAKSPHCWNTEQNPEMLPAKASVLQLTLHSNLQEGRQTKSITLHLRCVAFRLLMKPSKVLVTNVILCSYIIQCLCSLAFFYMVPYLTQGEKKICLEISTDYFYTVWPYFYQYMILSQPVLVRVISGTLHVSQKEALCFCYSLWRWVAGSLKVEILMDDDKFMWLVKEWGTFKQTMCLGKVVLCSREAMLFKLNLHSRQYVVKFENVVGLFFKVWCDYRLCVFPALSYDLPNSKVCHSRPSVYHNKGVVASVMKTMHCSQ